MEVPWLSYVELFNFLFVFAKIEKHPGLRRKQASTKTDQTLLHFPNNLKQAKMSKEEKEKTNESTE